MNDTKTRYGDWKNKKKQENTYQTLNNKYDKDKALEDSQKKLDTRPYENYIRRRDYQIKKQQQNQKKIDFNVYNYDIEELVAILNFQYIPINKGIINRRILEFKRKFKNQEKYLVFFDNAEQRLLEHLENVNAETWTEVYEKETSEAGKVLTERFQSQNEEQEKAKINQIINEDKNIIGQIKKPLDKTYAPKGIVQGVKNPFEIQEIIRLVNFDSSFRQFLPQVSTSCPETESDLSTTSILYNITSQRRLYTSTNYVVNLSQPLTNVISIALDSVEIPNQWYTFSPDYGTDEFTFQIRDRERIYKITLEEGNYSQQQLVNAINNQIWDKTNGAGDYLFRGYYDVSGNHPPSYPTSEDKREDLYHPFPLLEFKYTSYDNKIKICNHFKSSTIIDFNWYNTATDKKACAAKQESETPQPGGKVDYNLGWLMGFRGQTTTVYYYQYNGSPKWESNINSYSQPIYNTILSYSNITPSSTPITSITTEEYRNTIPNRSRTPPGNAYSYPLIETTTVGDKLYYGYTCPKSVVDIKGPRYFILVLDDFNNNKPNKDLISIIDTVDTQLKLPSYINLQTMDKKYGLGTYYSREYEGNPNYACIDVSDLSNNERACSTNSLNVDLKSNLTIAQKYTADEIQFFNKINQPNRFNSPNSPDLLARFPVNRNPLDNNNSIIYKNSDNQQPERKYFGPVKLVKFGIKLLNDKGFEVNIHDSDWSFSLIIKQLYQY